MEMSGQLYAPANFILGMHVAEALMGLRATLHVILAVLNNSKTAGSYKQLGNKFQLYK
jgi:hypothetical protein